jgi:hypothetical protein
MKILAALLVSVGVVNAVLCTDVGTACDVENCAWIGDGFCDQTGGFNTEACNYDGGDCCPHTCVDGKDHVCGERGTRGYACMHEGKQCTPVAAGATKGAVAIKGVGGIETPTSGTILKSDMPCVWNDYIFETCDTCEYPVTIQKGSDWMNPGTFFQQLYPDSEFFRWLPLESCAQTGCTILGWETKFLPAAHECFSGALSDSPCYCDDACTKFKDCCYDYQATCKAGSGIVNTFSYPTSTFKGELEEMDKLTHTNGEITLQNYMN